MKIENLLKQALPKWKYAACSRDGNWYFFSIKPKPLLEIGNWQIENDGEYLDLKTAFDVTKEINPLPEGISQEDSLICRADLPKKKKLYRYFVCFNFAWNQMGTMIIESSRKIKANEDLDMLSRQIQKNLNLSEPPFISNISKL